jgi:hypothetical protein
MRELAAREEDEPKPKGGEPAPECVVRSTPIASGSAERE